MSTTIKLEITPSPIHGNGLFAVEPIRKDTVIGLCETAPTVTPGDYTLWLGEDPVDVICHLRFINHSDRPNVIYYEDKTVVSLRDILPGEERNRNVKCILPHHPGNCHARVFPSPQPLPLAYRSRK